MCQTSNQCFVVGWLVFMNFFTEECLSVVKEATWIPSESRKSMPLFRPSTSIAYEFLTSFFCKKLQFNYFNLILIWFWKEMTSITGILWDKDVLIHFANCNNINSHLEVHLEKIYYLFAKIFFSWRNKTTACRPCALLSTNLIEENIYC